MAPAKTKDERKKELRDKGNVLTPDVLIVGSGPIGAVFARTLVAGGVNVLMVDMGAQSSKLAGDHHKNSVAVQKDLSLFTNVIRGQLSPLSVPDMPSIVPAPPGGFQPPDDKPFLYGNHNPHQEIKRNLAAAAATRVVGGMSTHWTCCTPRQYASASLHNERSDLFSPDEWEGLYKDCEKIFSTDTTGKVFADSVRQRLVMKKLKEAFDEDFRKGVKKDGQNAARQVSPMPLACKQTAGNKAYIEWTCTASILEKLAEPNNPSPNFTLMSQTQCDALYINTASQKIEWASIVDLVSNEEYIVTAKKYIICGGATLTAGIMAKSVFKSGLELETFCPALGKYLTEQSMSFCQVVLKQGFVDEVINTPEHLDKPGDTPEQKSSTKVIEHKKQHPEDPVPFPFEDFDPQVYTPYSEDYPWHTQIHRDAFGYGELPSNIDPRLVVDLRFFAQVEAVATNYISWKLGSTDAFGMPQPTFHFRLSLKDRERAQEMMTDMTHVASLLGDYIPGAEPQHLAPGLALHICGVYRAGKTENKQESVVDRAGKVWGMTDLYLGGCGVIPIGNASNPTLTAACHALFGARQIVQELKPSKQR